MRDRIGTIVSVIGGLLVIAGLIGLLTQDDDPTSEISAPGSSSSTTTAAAVPSTNPPTTTPPTTAAPTTAAPTTAPPTTAPPTTAAAEPPNQTVEEFFVEYVAAVEAGDGEFLHDRLHPVVLDQSEAELCGSFIEREILALGDYRMTGEVEGPIEREVAGTLIRELYSVPVAFEFQGETFEGTATFAPVAGQMHWFTECR